MQSRHGRDKAKLAHVRPQVTIQMSKTGGAAVGFVRWLSLVGRGLRSVPITSHFWTRPGRSGTVVGMAIPEDPITADNWP
jgi:hypothetical protein